MFLNHFTYYSLMTDHLSQSIRYLRIADHVVEKTYPTVKESKLLLAALEDLFLSLNFLMKAVVSEKEAQEFDDDFVHLFASFKQYGPGYGYKDDDFDIIFKIRRIIQSHLDADVEFSRNDKFIICEQQYNMVQLSVEDVKEYIFKAKHLLSRFESKK